MLGCPGLLARINGFWRCHIALPFVGFAFTLASILLVSQVLAVNFWCLLESWGGENPPGRFLKEASSGFWVWSTEWLCFSGIVTIHLRHMDLYGIYDVQEGCLLIGRRPEDDCPAAWFVALNLVSCCFCSYLMFAGHSLLEELGSPMVSSV